MKRIYKIIIGIVIAVPVILFAASWYFLDYALSHNTDFDEAREIDSLKINYPQLSQWIDSIYQTGAIKDTFIVNDGVKLHAKYLFAKTPTKHTAVLVHGYKDSHVTMLRYGYIFNKTLNYNFLIPDLYAHGHSEGDAIRMGWKDRRDVVRWINVADSIFGRDTQIAVLGLSMGGATTMMVSGESDVPSNVKAYIDDCGYSSVWNEFSCQLKEQFNLPAFPVLYAASGLCGLRYGWTFKEASALNQLPKCQKPMMFIHGDADNFVPTEMVYDVYKAHPGPKEMWLAKGSTHAYAYHDHPKEYTEHLKAFLDKYIK